MTYCAVCNGVHDPSNHFSWNNHKEAGMPFGIGKKQNTTYDARGRVASLGSIETQDEDPSPVVVAGIGSAALNRLAATGKPARNTASATASAP